jgi:signal transduction histidine kinase
MAELGFLIDSYRKNPAAMPPETEAMKGYAALDAEARSRLPAYLRDLPAGLSEAFQGQTEFHVAVSDEPEGRFIITYEVDAIEELEARYVHLLYAGLLATVFIAIGVGSWVAYRLVHPIRRLAQQVQNLDADPPRLPMAQEYQDEEISRLARAFDAYLAKVAEFVEREREFTGNVSHEVRTSITAIRTGCELLLHDSALAPDKRQRIEAIDRAAKRLTDNTRSLLYLARGGGGQDLEQVSVRESVDDAADSVIDAFRSKDIRFDNSVDAAAMIRTDRAALLIVLENLLRNAASYTDHGFVRASYRDGCVTIEDSGSGIDPAELPRVAERYYRGARTLSRDGIGLGLAIVKRICERFGWRLEIASKAGEGTKVAVFFPIAPHENQASTVTQS